MGENFIKKSIMVTRSSMPPLEEYIDEIREIWENHWMTNMGVKHQKFQQELIEYLDVQNIELLTNGHMSLELTLQAMNLHGEVITTPFTFASTTHAIVRNGLTPVFCDICMDDYTIDVSKIENLITEKTCAILPVHVYGNICDVKEIAQIAKKYSLKVIYDAAHSFGETYEGIGIGNFGDASCFSFHATKVFNSIEGGAVSFSDPVLGEHLYELKNFGIRGPFEVSAVGANAKMNEFCAAMGLCNLRHIDEEISKRKLLVERYRSNLEGISGVKLNCLQKSVKSNYSYFPVLIEHEIAGVSREMIFEELKRNDIHVRMYFYPLTNTFSCFNGIYDVRETPNAVYVSDRILTLPLYADLTFEEVDRICSIIIDVLHNNGR